MTSGSSSPAPAPPAPRPPGCCWRQERARCSAPTGTGCSSRDGRLSIRSRASLAALTNPHGVTGSADDALAGADVYIGLSSPGAVSVEGIRSMTADPIVFAMANPRPEVPPRRSRTSAAVLGTGRSDYPNQINNVLAFPGVFRGALDVRATTITREMELAAAHALAEVVERRPPRAPTT